MEEPDGSGRHVQWIAAVLIVVIGLGAVLAYAAGRHSRDDSSARRIPTTGVACPALKEASGALQARDYSALRASIRMAERRALKALDRTGIKFGRPERYALSLGAVDLQGSIDSGLRSRIEEKLEAATAACTGSVS